MKSIELEPCSSPLWARGGHQQTLVGHFIPSPKIKLDGQWETIPLEDQKDQIRGVYYPGTRDVTVVLFHGLGGSTESGYMQRIGQIAINLKCHVFLVNHRGAGCGAGIAEKPYHSGRAQDAADVYEYLRRKLPGTQIISIGFSLGAAVVLLNLAGVLSNATPDAAIAVNGPIDLKRVSGLLHRGFNRVYDLNFVNDCRRDLRSKNTVRSREVLKKIRWHSKLYEIDDIYTAPFSGFVDRHEYYDICSSKHHLHRIQKPTYILTSLDDPFIDAMDYKNTEFSKSTKVHIELTGGHLGYLTKKRTILGNYRWMDYAIYEFLQNLI